MYFTILILRISYFHKISKLYPSLVSGQNVQLEHTLGGLGQQLDNLLRSLLGPQGLNGVTGGLTGGSGLGGLTGGSGLNGLTGGLTGGSGLNGLTGGLTSGNALNGLTGGLTGGSGVGGLTNGLTGNNGLLGGLTGRQEPVMTGPNGDRITVEWNGRSGLPKPESD